MARSAFAECAAEPVEDGGRSRLGWLVDLVRIDARTGADKLLILLLVADAVLIVLHMLHSFTPVFPLSDYAITTERGFGETLQYFKEGWIAVVLLILAARLRRIGFACWAIVIGLLLWDDLYRFRELHAPILAQHLDLPALFGLRPRDLGELIFVGSYVVFLVLPIAVAYRLSMDDGRRFWWSMVVLLASLFGFGVVSDLFHTAVLSSPPWGAGFALVEDGGEMVVMSLILRFVFQAWQQTDHSWSTRAPA